MSTWRCTADFMVAAFGQVARKGCQARNGL